MRDSGLRWRATPSEGSAYLWDGGPTRHLTRLAQACKADTPNFQEHHPRRKGVPRRAPRKPVPCDAGNMAVLREMGLWVQDKPQPLELVSQLQAQRYPQGARGTPGLPGTAGRSMVRRGRQRQSATRRAVGLTADGRGCEAAQAGPRTQSGGRRKGAKG